MTDPDRLLAEFQKILATMNRNSPVTDQDPLPMIKANMAASRRNLRPPYITEDAADWLVGEVERLRDAVAVAMRLADEEATEGRRLHSLLARLEWSAVVRGHGRFCPGCGWPEMPGADAHDPGCWLAAELRDP